MEIQKRAIQTENSKGKDPKLRGASLHVRRMRAKPESRPHGERGAEQ